MPVVGPQSRLAMALGGAPGVGELCSDGARRGCASASSPSCSQLPRRETACWLAQD
ncbi:hypothetical protein CHLRE_02g095094v5 [Chlamydomonas reinhardtii]|uniref:Uncharacterized protein n=1 Tax=Chlamydomonas reinhardtii TaxID=3055 RepID=A0A2K3E1P2_CHLRE|nr:uncharacterized protein CHLRE_02g095094v5 [Chlamydomonas reinhardtii]PNW86708.1 hypothetical protein CHLRE_02g095094v5 [Chlamydomonas reinhardtii]